VDQSVLAAKNKNWNEFIKLFSLYSLYAGNINLNNKNNQGKTAAHVAAEERRWGIFFLLVEKKREAVNPGEQGGLDQVTPLMLAVEQGNGSVVHKLLTGPGIKERININAKDKQGKTAFDRAVESKNSEIVSLLVKHRAGLDKAACSAAENKDWDAVFKAVERGADPNATNDSQYTLLMMATEQGNLDIVKRLVEEFEVDLLAKQENGWTAADVAGHVIKQRTWYATHFEFKDMLNPQTAQQAIQNYQDIENYLKAQEKTATVIFDDIPLFLRETASISANS
jgi:ankyrin repeat protein